LKKVPSDNSTGPVEQGGSKKVSQINNSFIFASVSQKACKNLIPEASIAPVKAPNARVNGISEGHYQLRRQLFPHQLCQTNCGRQTCHMLTMDQMAGAIALMSLMHLPENG